MASAHQAVDPSIHSRQEVFTPTQVFHMESTNSIWSVPAIYDGDSTWSPAGIHSSSMWANVEDVELHVDSMWNFMWNFMAKFKWTPSGGRSPDFINIDNKTTDKEDHDDKDTDMDKDDHNHDCDDNGIDIDMDDCDNKDMNADDHNNEDAGKGKAKSKADSDSKCEEGEAKTKANSNSKCEGVRARPRLEFNWILFHEVKVENSN
ncbi:hypothetical protein CVT25_000874 [Psilocybe cyanescens]|uniref:Uncharacterized protein n=1 Tax=Psilocybe cyanescens TaxID=93625 RepID=A0A409XET1_PSICY|nr:hypothetical protein CVT25_000874 [Psilocybe cyanescens]